MLRVLGVSAVLCAAMMSGAANASGSDVHHALTQALTCEGTPLDTVRELAAAGGSRVQDGFIGFEFGEEIDTVSGVTLQSPLIVADARTHSVIASVATFHTDFNALVFARFSGDHARAVAEYNLIQDADTGVYRKVTPGDDADDVCPPTIELRRLEGDEFLLGCGWCNG